MRPATPDRLRLAELVAALSLAIDLGMAQPMAHALRTCLFAVALGRALGFPDRELADTYNTTLLRFVGCTSDAHDFLDFAAGDDVGFRQMLATVANGTPDEVASHLVRFMTQARVRGDIGARVRVSRPHGGTRAATRKRTLAHVPESAGHSEPLAVDARDGEDLRYRRTEGARPDLRTRLMHRYMDAIGRLDEAGSDGPPAAASSVSHDRPAGAADVPANALAGLDGFAICDLRFAICDLRS
jgi:hypothetical protein